MFRFLCIVAGLGLLNSGCGSRDAATRAAATTAAPDPQVWFRYHFVGSKQLDVQGQGSRLKDLLALPELAPFREQVYQKLSRAPKELLTQRINTAHVDRSPFFRPLIEDLFQAESGMEWRQGQGQKAEWTLAVRLEDARAQLWSTNLWQVMREWEAGSPTPIPGGWELKKHATPNLFRLVRSGSWLVAGLGQDRLPNLEATLGRIKAGGGPMPSATGAWLTVEADLTRFAPALGLATNTPYPRAQLAWGGKGTNVRTTGRLMLPQPLKPSLPDWRIPTNYIREPLISFGAWRACEPWVAPSSFTRQLGIQPTPDQLVTWSLKSVPFQSYIGFPTSDPTNLMTRMVAQWPSTVGAQIAKVGTFEPRWNAARTEVMLAGLPFAMPNLRAVQDAGSSFLVVGGFPFPTNAPAMPAELTTQFMGRPDVVYYHWELTPARLVQCRALAGLRGILSGQNPTVLTNAPGQVWLAATEPHLRNVVTEIRRVGPAELELTRSSQLGLTALELYALVSWLDSDGFPLHGQQLSAPPKR